ncbi:carbohydrate-binding module family 50 protein [Xylaria palmicola]|nr:carbohydrate-binding module family 50 protein [Xylaria palmicola]
MPRWSEYDTDEERLPEGMQRIGYDADTQVYTFRDADGSVWESAPGSQYGQLRRVAGSTLPSYGDDDENTSPAQPLAYDGLGGAGGGGRAASWRQEMMPLLNWFLLVGLFLLVVVWFISGASRGGPAVVRSCGDDASAYEVRAGDTCWAIAEAKSVSVDALLESNEGLDCDKLSIGETVCVPVMA